MDPLGMLGGLVVLAGYGYWHLRKKQQEARNAVQFMDHELGQVHFPSMLLLDDEDALYELRPDGTGNWQQKPASTTEQFMYEQWKSWNEKGTRKEFEAERVDLLSWRPLVWPEMETAFLRFIHAPDVKLDETVRKRWEEGAERRLESKREAKWRY